MSTNKATSENGFMPNTSTISSSRSKFWREFKAEIVKETTLAEASAKYPRMFQCSTSGCKAPAESRCFCATHENSKLPFHCTTHACARDSFTALKDIHERLEARKEKRKKPVHAGLLDHGLEDIQAAMQAWSDSPKGGNIGFFGRSPEGEIVMMSAMCSNPRKKLAAPGMAAPAGSALSDYFISIVNPLHSLSLEEITALDELSAEERFEKLIARPMMAEALRGQFIVQFEHRMYEFLEGDVFQQTVGFILSLPSPALRLGILKYGGVPYLTGNVDDIKERLKRLLTLPKASGQQTFLDGDVEMTFTDYWKSLSPALGHKQHEFVLPACMEKYVQTWLEYVFKNRQKKMFPLVRLMREKAGAIAPESWQDTLSKLQPSWDALCGLERAKYDKNTLPMSFLLSAYGGITAENLKTTRDACQLMDNCGWMACFGCTFTDLDEKLAEVGKLVGSTKKQTSSNPFSGPPRPLGRPPAAKRLATTMASAARQTLDWGEYGDDTENSSSDSDSEDPPLPVTPKRPRATSRTPQKSPAKNPAKNTPMIKLPPPKLPKPSEKPVPSNDKQPPTTKKRKAGPVDPKGKKDPKRRRNRLSISKPRVSDDGDDVDLQVLGGGSEPTRKAVEQCKQEEAKQLADLETLKLDITVPKKVFRGDASRSITKAERTLLEKFTQFETIKVAGAEGTELQLVLDCDRTRASIASAKGLLFNSAVQAFVNLLQKDPKFINAKSRVILDPFFWKKRFECTDPPPLSSKEWSSWMRSGVLRATDENPNPAKSIEEIIGVAMGNNTVPGHFAAYHIDLTKGTVTVYDSLIGSKAFNDKDFTTAAKELNEFFGKPAKKGWKFLIVELAKQTNTIDCGLYVCKAVQQLSLGVKPKMSQEVDVPAVRAQLMLSFATGRTYDQGKK